MQRDPRSRRQGYTLDRAIDDVFGRRSLGPWPAVIWIVFGGIAGALVSRLLVSTGATPHPALRWAACAGYGMVVAAVLSVLPRAARLVGLRSSLGKRPADDGGEEPWWPLRLLAAALRGTPGLRRTQQDFDAAVDRTGPAARSILVHRMWPAWVAAFIVPVLGLLSAWEAGSQIDRIDGEKAFELFMRFVPQVSPPMIATIGASLGLMAVLAVVDQLTKGLLQRWGGTVRFSDDATAVVKRLLDDLELAADEAGGGSRDAAPPPLGPRSGPTSGAVSGPGSAPESGNPDEPPPGPTAADLDELAGAFSNRGRKP